VNVKLKWEVKFLIFEIYLFFSLSHILSMRKYWFHEKIDNDIFADFNVFRPRNTKSSFWNTVCLYIRRPLLASSWADGQILSIFDALELMHHRSMTGKHQHSCSKNMGQFRRVPRTQIVIFSKTALTILMLANMFILPASRVGVEGGGEVSDQPPKTKWRLSRKWLQKFWSSLNHLWGPCLLIWVHSWHIPKNNSRPSIRGSMCNILALSFTYTYTFFDNGIHGWVWKPI
jgi:hypothetical protein